MHTGGQHLTNDSINDWYKKNEAKAVDSLLKTYSLSKAKDQKISRKAEALIRSVRQHPEKRTQIEDFMQVYQLSTEEGIALMTMAECLLRIPDKKTANALIRDKIMSADWDQDTEKAAKKLTDLSSLGMSLSNMILTSDKTVFGKLAKRLGEPVIREAMVQAMRLMGGHFVTGQTITEALKEAGRKTGQDESKTLSYSFDMLGEGARDWRSANQYLASYQEALHAVGQAHKEQQGLFKKHGVSVKLSALHPHYDLLKAKDCQSFLIKTVLDLALLAKEYDINLTIDAEEARRLDLSLDIFAAVLAKDDLQGWDGLGLAIQAYQKRCLPLVDWLADLGSQTGHRIPVRLVKGAYWDSEIKYAQVNGLEEYPVYTRKVSTDLSYLCVAKKMLKHQSVIYPQFATHNAHTLCALEEMLLAIPEASYEFQRLHGMAEGLYAQFFDQADSIQKNIRVYAPVGAHADLLPYLVRRFLENGANTSFVNQVHDDKVQIKELAQSPAFKIQELSSKRHPSVPLPRDLYLDRKNAATIDLYDQAQLAQLTSVLETYQARRWTSTSILNGEMLKGKRPEKSWKKIYNPADKAHVVGYWMPATPKQASAAVEGASMAFDAWSRTPVEARAELLEKLADDLEKERMSFVPLLVFEAGKTVQDAIAEIREAIDFCRYYAGQAKALIAEKTLTGPTGESNQLMFEPRGVFACISPWNFPLAIFIGQIAAALVTGNTVVAKPAEQTPLIAGAIVRLMKPLGLPDGVLNLVLGNGKVGSTIVNHEKLAGVAFTGSTETAWLIQDALNKRHRPIRPLIAETGGLNAMIVDSSALPEQVVDDVIGSAFLSAGQRCSALRVLYLQEEIAETILDLLKGAMETLVVGNPALIDTDMGPVIDGLALKKLKTHQKKMSKKYQSFSYKSDKTLARKGHFLFPSIHEIQNLQQIGGEKFGPILHVIRYKKEAIDDVIEEINDTGFGLTFGIHSRIDGFIDYVSQRIQAGNIYINRSMTGAVVGVQPFGGRGLSGTGPKAGGPYYLHRFMTEKTYSDNITVRGGDTALMLLDDSEDL